MKNKIAYALIALITIATPLNTFGEALPAKNLSVSQIQPATPAVQQPYTSFAYCTKIYPLSTEALLYMCLSAINENNYIIQEIQFKTGTIIFAVNQKEFILTTARKDIKNSFIKILPVDNNYNFAPTPIQKVFSYIDINSGLGVQSII